MIFKKLFIALITIVFTNSCTSKKDSQKTTNQKQLEYAKGFLIETYNGYKKVTIKQPYQNAKTTFEYLLVPKGKNIPKHKNTTQIIRTPIERIVVTSTSHIPLLELLNEEGSLVGFPNTDFVSSRKTRALIDTKKVQDLGKEQNINTEILLALQPELVISFAVNKPNKSFSTLQKMGVPILLNGDWLEKTPLARAEWIQLFGALYHKEKQADSIFKHIKTEYNKAKTIALQAKRKPTVLSGSIFQDVWYLPAGESFIATYFKDAQTNYLWENTSGTGSLSLNFENVFEKGKNADFWLGCGLYDSKEKLNTGNKHYKNFDAYNSNTIYTFAKNKGTTGGLLYFELGPMRPDIILKDIIKVTHPELLPDYTPYFFEKL